MPAGWTRPLANMCRTAQIKLILLPQIETNKQKKNMASKSKYHHQFIFVLIFMTKARLPHGPGPVLVPPGLQLGIPRRKFVEEEKTLSLIL